MLCNFHIIKIYYANVFIDQTNGVRQLLLRSKILTTHVLRTHEHRENQKCELNRLKELINYNYVVVTINVYNCNFPKKKKNREKSTLNYLMADLIKTYRLSKKKKKKNGV